MTRTEIWKLAGYKDVNRDEAGQVQSSTDQLVAPCRLVPGIFLEGHGCATALELLPWYWRKEHPAQERFSADSSLQSSPAFVRCGTEHMGEGLIHFQAARLAVAAEVQYSATLHPEYKILLTFSTLNSHTSLHSHNHCDADLISILFMVFLLHYSRQSFSTDPHASRSSFRCC